MDESALRIRHGSTEIHLSSESTLTLGSDDSCEIVVPDSPPEWVTIRFVAQWVASVHDEQTRVEFAGSIHKGPGVVRLEAGLEGGTPLILYRESVTAQLSICRTTGADTYSSHPTAPVASRRIGGISTRWLTIGRSGGGADVQLEGPDVAIKHSSLRVREDGQGELKDHSGQLGTFVNGAAVLFARVTSSDTILIGQHVLWIDGRTLFERPLSIPIALSCESLSAFYRPNLLRRLTNARPFGLENVSFQLPACKVLALVGPSGMGKSTLCAALLGELSDTAGEVWLDSVNLLSADRRIQQYVSFVPQQDALLGELSVKAVLSFAAKIKLPSDTSALARKALIAEVLSRVRLDKFESQRVERLSGGQRKRVSIAVELLTSPPLILLDEPTSGLDEGLDYQIMQDLQGIARSGSAVVVVTHSTANLDQADFVMALARPGRVAFFGRPGELLNYFSATRYHEVMLSLHEGNVPRAGGLPGVGSSTAVRRNRGSGSSPQSNLPTPKRAADSSKRLAALCLRELQRVLTKKMFLFQALIIAPLLAFCLATFASRTGFGGSPTAVNTKINISLAVLTVCTAFFAMTLTYSSIVGDKDAIARERRWGVTALETILSRALVYGILSLIQVGLLVKLYSLVRQSPQTALPEVPGWTSVYIGLALLGLASMAVGLLISTVSRSLPQASSLLALGAVVMIVLAGLLIPLGAVEDTPTRILSVASYFMPTRWSVALIGASVRMTEIGPTRDEAMWTADVEHVYTSGFILVGFLVVIIVLCCILLKRRSLGSR